LRAANAVHPRLRNRGGGVRGIEVPAGRHAGRNGCQSGQHDL
jgi:hypothetical protein